VMRAMPKRFAACFSESKFGYFSVVSMVAVHYKSHATELFRNRLILGDTVR
jgi:hypothetical protein